MTILYRLRAFWRWLFRREQIEQSLASDLEDYIDRSAAEKIQAGMDESEARRAARIELGGVEQTKDRVRATLALGRVGALITDAGYATRGLARQLRRHPAFFIVVVLTLGLGIGATSAVFSVVNTVLLKPLSYQDSDRLVWLWSVDSREQTSLRVSYPDFIDWQSESQTLQLVGHGGLEAVLTGRGDPIRLQTRLLIGDLFGLLGVPPMIGSVAVDANTSEEPFVVLSHSLWRRQFGSDPNVVGSVATLNGVSYTVAAVMPSGFEFPVRATEPVDAWIPLARFNPALARSRDARLIEVIGRLRSNATLEQAQAEMNVIASALSEQYPGSNANIGVRITSALDEVTRDYSRGVLLLGVTVGILLVITCINVASLLLVRSIVRGREFAIRSTLGAPRARISFQLIMESALLAVLGAVLGCILAVWGVELLRSLLAGTLPRATDIKLDLSVLGFAAVTSLGIGFLFGLAPAWNASSQNLTALIGKDAGKGLGGVRGKRIADGLVVAEVALATLLLAGAGAFVQSYWQLNQSDLQVESDHVLTFDISWPSGPYPDPSVPFARLQSELLSIPGVVSASTGIQLPGRGQAMLDDTSPYAQLEGQPIPNDERRRVSTLTVQPGYFETLAIPLIAGRDFSDNDQREQPMVVLVNESFAQSYLGDRNPIGRRISLDSWTLLGKNAAEIVGVVKDVGYQGISDAVDPLVYLPMSQRPTASATMVVRTSADPLNLVPAIREAVRRIDAYQPIDNIQTLERRFAGVLVNDRTRAFLLSGFSILAVVLAAVGLFGVMSYATSQQTRKIGVKMALGATARSILWGTVWYGMRWVLIGTFIGVVASIVLTQIFGALLFEVSSVEPLSIGAVLAVMFLTAVLACAIPASRSSRTNPVVVLRYE